jgi:hypothetical protein
MMPGSGLVGGGRWLGSTGLYGPGFCGTSPGFCGCPGLADRLRAVCLKFIGCSYWDGERGTTGFRFRQVASYAAPLPNRAWHRSCVATTSPVERLRSWCLRSDQGCGTIAAVWCNYSLAG